MANQRYKLRYSFEVGDFSPTKIARPRPGVAIAEDSDKYGYCDEAMFASVVIREDGSRSILLMSNEHGEPHSPPSRKFLTEIRDLINHTLEHH